MNQKYQNACIYVGISILLLLLPLLLTAQTNLSKTDWNPLKIQQEIERATLQELYLANPKHLFSDTWNELKAHSSSNVCELSEVTCNSEGLIFQLDLSRKKLIVIPASIHNLKSLSHLELHENELTELPASLGSMSQLDAITFYENKLSYLPESLKNICGAIVRNGVRWNPVDSETSWVEFCQGH